MGRSPCCEKVGLKKGPWTPEEDQKLLAYIDENGDGSWRALPAKAGLQRCGKSCRLRWTNYLRPDIKRGKFSLQEEQTIIQLHALLGNRWSAIATHLPKRTDNEIKNYWNTHLKKRLAKMGIDPVTHKPKSSALSSPDGAHLKNAATLSHMAQWESARLEAETRLARESKLRAASTGSTSSSLNPHLPPFELNASPASPQPLGIAGGGPAPKPARRHAQHPGRADQESPTSTLNFSADSIPGLRPAPREEEAAAFFALEPAMFCGNAPWLHDPLRHVGFADGFTDMLLDAAADEDDDEEASPASSVGAVAAPEEVGEENKSYWNSILNLVNSGSPAGSSPLF